MKIISRFRGDYNFLSNFADSPFDYEGFHYNTVEHAYQERKTIDETRRILIREARTAKEAARLGRAKETILRPSWLNGLKREVMQKLVWEKFKQNPLLATMLLETRDAILIEGNYWHDNYFGICSCSECHDSGIQAENILGEILMDVRIRISEEQGIFNVTINKLDKKYLS